MNSVCGSGLVFFILAKCAGDDKPGCPILDAHLGQKVNQDWYRAVRFGVEMVQSCPGAQLLFVTGLKFPWWKNQSELSNYVSEAKMLGMRDDQLVAIEEGGETISQLEAAELYARTTKKQLVIVSTWTHYLRVRWLCRGKGYQHCAIFGMPILKPLIADVIFTFTFPIIDILGLRPWFLRRLQQRRANGKI